jgi:hypothetical protein
MRQHLPSLMLRFFKRSTSMTNDTWYDSAEIAGLALNIKKGRINDCCAGRQKSAGGLKFARKKCGDQS